MRNIKLYEQYNRDETLLGLAKMGLRNNRKEVFDLAVGRGFDVENNFSVLKEYCIDIVNYNSMEWIYPNKEKYQEYIDSITILSCSNNSLTSLEGISGLTQLTHLYCNNNDLTSLEGISGLTQLTTLSCSNNSLTTLEGISGLTRLTYLSCYNNSLTDLEGISGLTRLTNLDCRNNSLTDLEGISGLTRLTYLSCYNNPLPQEIIDMGIEEIQNYYKNQQ